MYEVQTMVSGRNLISFNICSLIVARRIDDSKTKRCAPCALQSDGDDISCQYMFSLCVEDQNGDKLVLSVGDEDGVRVLLLMSPPRPNHCLP
jgi:hypothetical protein